MEYISSYDEMVNGHEVNIYELEDGSFRVDVHSSEIDDDIIGSEDNLGSFEDAMEFVESLIEEVTLENVTIRDVKNDGEED